MASSASASAIGAGEPVGGAVVTSGSVGGAAVVAMGAVMTKARVSAIAPWALAPSRGRVIAVITRSDVPLPRMSRVRP